MADLHVKSTGSATSPFNNWANGATTLGGVSGAVAGDRYLVSSAHAATPATVNITFPGTPANPNQIIGGTEAGASGLSAISAGAKEIISGTTFTMNGSFYMDSIQWEYSSGSSYTPAFAGAAGNIQKFKSCAFRFTGAAGSPAISFGSGSSGAGTYGQLVDCWFRGASANFYVAINRKVDIFGGGWEAGGTNPTAMFYLGYGTKTAELNINGFDASAVGTATNIIGTVSEGSTSARIRGMKLPAGWTGSLVTAGQMKAGTRIEMIDYQVGTTLKKCWIEDGVAGNIKDETTVKLSADYSYKAVTTASCKYPLSGLSFPGHRVKLTAGVAKTITLNVLTDNIQLTNAEAWLEAEIFTTAGSHAIALSTSMPTDVLAAPANLTTNAAAWTTTGLATPIKQQISITITPQQDGYAHIRPKLARPSTTAYFDNTVTVA